MADNPDSVVNQFCGEVESAADAAYALSQRCRMIVAKAEANGLLDAKLPAGSERDMEAIRAAFQYIIKDMVGMFDNAEIGKTDRTTKMWQVNRAKGV